MDAKEKVLATMKEAGHLSTQVKSQNSASRSQRGRDTSNHIQPHGRNSTSERNPTLSASHLFPGLHPDYRGERSILIFFIWGKHYEWRIILRSSGG